jgi:hypothetical protein
MSEECFMFKSRLQNRIYYKKIVQSSFRTDIENIFRTLGEESIWISKMK